MTYSSLIVSILIVCVVINLQNETRVRAMLQPWLVPLTPEQTVLMDGVYKESNWTDLWFDKVRDMTEWVPVERLINPHCRPGSWKKLRMIPKMMGCTYGVQFSWFLTLAVRVIDECRRMSQNDVGNTGVGDTGGQCWKELAVVLQGGSYTTLEVMRSLTCTHSTIGDHSNSDAFYQTMLTIQDSLSTVEIPEGHGYLYQIDHLSQILKGYLTHNCRPKEVPQLDTDVLMKEFESRFPSFNSYDFFLHTMKYYMDDISTHLSKMGFRYDMGTGHTNYIYPTL